LISDYKISYFGYDLPNGFLDELRRELQMAGQHVNVVYSSQRDLDILPAGVDKGSATAWLAKHWQFESRRVIVAGDSGNDLAMFQLGFRGIVVGNAHQDLKSLSGPNIYHAKGNCAAGVLEGMRYWLDNGG
jgi:hydroxymethylpyrimidine pyrophosphatase-like HAD family hydrolase